MTAPAPTTLLLKIRVEVYQPSYSQNGLSIIEEFELPARSFLEVCQILGQFHNLTEQLRKEGVK